ncbi:putative acyl-CoA synthetase [Methanocella paludicola SANAE]|uniref:Acyl-CoA synthetase n=1 Tax=Methanocella paludicola (strain DSM 17711 / JCM 13418 / NBRC 101707 / SANAE) TaxID=304371 RepID=D1YX35_METPS|nr:AMP-binding protein [Methanocella paludicola]BAI61007.1 putative acyl-CoA synthetase [Methanocella paludicola SANAE]
MSLLHKFLEKTEFDSYEDFRDNFKIKVPSNFNFAYDVIDVMARETPDKLALVWCDDNGGEQIMTFADIKRMSDKVANFLKGIGIKKGDAVMLALKGRYEWWYVMVALHRIGAIAIPATHMLTTKDITYRVQLADIKMIITANEKSLIDHVDKAQKECSLKFKAVVGGKYDGWIDFDTEVEKAPEHFERPKGKEATKNEDILILYFTSGTVGLPKMVQHNFVYPLGHILTAKYWQNVMDDGLHYTVADTGWAKAVWGKIYGQWISGSAVFAYDYEEFNPARLLAMTSKYKVTTFCAPPTIYRFLIHEDMSKYDFSSLKYCVVAGEPLNPEVYNKWLERTGLKLMEGFGQTEMTVALGTYPWIEPRPGSMGKPSPGYNIELISLDGKKCEAGEEGEIVVNTMKGLPAGIFDGYYRDDRRTKSVWHDGYYYTGDMAWMDEEGYFWFVGRSDDVIKSSGYRIGPFEVESALITHPAVVECAITAVPDEIRGQIVKATVVLKKDYTPSDALKKELQDHVKKVTAPYKYPRIVEFVPALPKTISGKIRRVEIRDHDKK